MHSHARARFTHSLLNNPPLVGVTQHIKAKSMVYKTASAFRHCTKPNTLWPSVAFYDWLQVLLDWMGMTSRLGWQRHNGASELILSQHANRPLGSVQLFLSFFFTFHSSDEFISSDPERKKFLPGSRILNILVISMTSCLLIFRVVGGSWWKQGHAVVP